MLLSSLFKKIFSFRSICIGMIAMTCIILGFTIQDELRRNAKFRSMQDPIETQEIVDLRGLRELPYSGGPPISFATLKQKLPYKKIVVVQGMIDKHGFYKGIPTGRLGYKQNPLLKHYFYRLYHTHTLWAFPEKTVPEKVEAQNHGLQYASFPVGSKHTTPDHIVDQFVEFMDQLPDDVGVYFHCNQGQGRTTVMLVMADILKNAPQVSVNDIVKRQHLLGSEDLFNTTPWTKGTYGKAMLENRKKFIEKFYEFASQRKSGGERQWSKWNQRYNDAALRNES